MSSTDPISTLAALQAVDVATAAADECARLLGDTKRLRGWVDAFEARLTRRMSELHETSGSWAAGRPSRDRTHEGPEGSDDLATMEWTGKSTDERIGP